MTYFRAAQNARPDRILATGGHTATQNARPDRILTKDITAGRGAGRAYLRTPPHHPNFWRADEMGLYFYIN